MKIQRFVFPSAFFTSFVIFLALYLTFWTRIYRNSGEDAVVKIVKGDNLRTVAAKLESSQVIFNKYLFIIAGKLMGYQEEIIPGEYRFNNGLTSLSILKTITDGSVVRTYNITIPEGMNVRQTGRLLQRLYGLDSARFVRETYNDSLIGLLGVKAENLEGFLYPDTYQISYSANSNKEQEVVRVMAAEFRRKINPEMKDEMKKRNISLKELITMASIIEGETRYEPEKKTIAGVYYNRLKKRMKLEADPTVQFALPNGPKRQLLYSDLKYPSPYNTYLNRGLPPGPINSPGLGSIMAALYPEDNNYIYFVAKGDGSHRFAENYEQHKKNIAQYKKYLEDKKEQEEQKTQEEKKNHD